MSISDPPADLLLLAAAALMFFNRPSVGDQSFSAIWSTHCVLETDFWSSYFLNPASCRMELVLCGQTSAGRVEIPLLNVVLRYTQRPTMGDVPAIRLFVLWTTYGVVRTSFYWSAHIEHYPLGYMDTWVTVVRRIIYKVIGSLHCQRIFPDHYVSLTVFRTRGTIFPQGP